MLVGFRKSSMDWWASKTELSAQYSTTKGLLNLKAISEKYVEESLFTHNLGRYVGQKNRRHSRGISNQDRRRNKENKSKSFPNQIKSWCQAKRYKTVANVFLQFINWNQNSTYIN